MPVFSEIRLEKAKELLKSNHRILIKDVAQMVGYNDQFYFSRIFHSYTGVSPVRIYRNKKLGEVCPKKSFKNDMISVPVL